MTLIGLVVFVLVLALVGFLVHLVTTQIPMPQIMQTAIYVVVVVFIILYLLALLTGNVSLGSLKVG